MDPGQTQPRGLSRTRRRAVALGVGTALVAGVAVGALGLAGAPEASAEASLQPFTGCDELVAWYRDATLPHVTPFGLGDVGAGWAVAAEEAGSLGGAVQATRDDTAATGDAVGSSGTGTNVQEAGVDEPSRIKVADGVAYTLAGQRLVVVDLAAGAVLGEVTLAPTGPPEPPGGTGGTGGDAADMAVVPSQRHHTELLLVEDRVVVLGSATLPAEKVRATGPGPVEGTAGLMPYPQPWGAPTTTATTVDVSDPEAPTVVDTVEVEGGYVSARATGGDVRLVTTATPVLPFVDPYLLQQDRLAGPEEDQALAHNQQVVREATASDWLPDLITRDQAGTVVTRTPVGCDDVAHPTTDAGSGTLTVLTLDPGADSTLVETTSVSADGSVVYASTDRMYVATTTGGWLWGGRGDGRVSTDLHGFTTTQPGRTDYLGSGQVDGWLLGSWAMDSHDGHLRVGVTSTSPQPGPGGPGTPDADALVRPAATSSSVVVLQETSAGLAQVGRVDGLGPGEQIRSLRWFDDLAVVVTFQQTDPLYTVDLADPAAPQVLGELKVLGYSGYLHPVGDGMLLGLGQDGTDDGMLLGAKVETYDLTDLSSPTDLDSLTWPRSSSAAEGDSRLFAYLPGSRTAVLPLERLDRGSYGAGLVSVTVGTDGSLAEAGSWLGEDAGWIGGLATTAEQVLVTSETWGLVDGAESPLTVLTVLSTDGLGVQAEVPLG